MPVTLWDSFDNLLSSAESNFLNLDFDKALDDWRQYYKITARIEYQRILDEIERLLDRERLANLTTLNRLYNIFSEHREQYRSKKISHFTYHLYNRLFIKIYREKFQTENSKNISIEAGVFEYLSNRTHNAIHILTQVIEKRPDSVTGRIFLGHSFMALKDNRSAIEVLTQNLFLSPDELDKEDLYLSQFKLLSGRLHSKISDEHAAAWLLTFETWYRNWLIIKEDQKFFNLIKNKETNERILQVKYSQMERYRHFALCLFVADYTRHFNKKNSGLIIEQENYMQKLDAQLYSRFRNKRKSIEEKVISENS